MSMPWALSATKPRTGARLNKASDSWSKIATALPNAAAGDGSRGLRGRLPARPRRVENRPLSDDAWYAPQWKGATKTMGIGIGQKFEGQWLVNKHAGDVSYYTHVCFQVGGCSM